MLRKVLRKFYYKEVCNNWQAQVRPRSEHFGSDSRHFPERLRPYACPSDEQGASPDA